VETECKEVHSQFITRELHPPSLDFGGPLTGTLAGSFLSTELVLMDGRPETPSVKLFTERFDITTKRGTVLRTIGAGSFDLVSGLFAELTTIIEQNGQAGNFGQLFLRGTYDATTNVGLGDYRGEVCE